MKIEAKKIKMSLIDFISQLINFKLTWIKLLLLLFFICSEKSNLLRVKCECEYAILLIYINICIVLNVPSFLYDDELSELPDAYIYLNNNSNMIVLWTKNTNLHAASSWKRKVREKE